MERGGLLDNGRCTLQLAGKSPRCAANATLAHVREPSFDKVGFRHTLAMAIVQAANSTS